MMYSTKISLLLFSILLLTDLTSQAQPSLQPFHDGIHHWNLLHKERHYARYTPEQYPQIADNLIAYQNADGGWPKNLDWLAVLDADSVKRALDDRYRQSTLDNRNVFSQIGYLAQVYLLTGQDKYKQAAVRGLQYLLNTQKANGGWRGWDVDAITFNDDVTTGALELFRDIVQGDTCYRWLSAPMRQQIDQSYRRGLSVVLRCQVRQQGVLTAWGQQHHNVTLEPVGARTFELPSLTANESCEIVLFLMGIHQPSDSVVAAVDAAVAWLTKVQIQGLRVERVSLPEDKIINHEYPYDNVVVADATAPPIWARFYEVTDNTPFMATRQGQKVWRLEDVNAERRTGYQWYGYWPQTVLKRYPGWHHTVRGGSK